MSWICSPRRKFGTVRKPGSYFDRRDVVGEAQLRRSSWIQFDQSSVEENSVFKIIESKSSVFVVPSRKSRRIPLMMLLNFYAAFVRVSKTDVNDVRCVVDVVVGERL